jgi:DNA-binding MarR family transcriptional regulator
MTTTTQPSISDAFTLASRFLQAFDTVAKTLLVDQVSRYEDLNISQLRIFQLVQENPGIRANSVMERLNLAPETARILILAMEKTGLLALDRSAANALPSLQLGKEGQRMSYQVKATQLSILAEMFGKLPEDHQVAAVEGLEQLAKQQLA